MRRAEPVREGDPSPSPSPNPDPSPNHDHNHNPNQVAVRGNEQRSRKEERTNYPMWNERLVWQGKRGELCNPKMLVEVLAWDPLTPTSMGRAEVDLALSRTRTRT